MNMFQRHKLPFVASAALVLIAGCCSTGRREVAYVGPPVAPAPCDRCAIGALPPRVMPAPAAVAVPAIPPGAVVAPPAASAIPAVPAPGQVVQGGYTPSAPPQSSPQEPTVRLAPPELSTPGPGQSREPPVAAQAPATGPERRDASMAVPIDIPQFAIARPKVANGLQPFPDGVVWLRDNRYRAVLHVHAPGVDDTAARRQFEKYGLRYIALEAEPRTLSKATVDAFNRLVSDEGNLPLFVYDKDASLTGGLWYLYYRLMEGYSDEKARGEAARLGFRLEQDERHQTMWIAVQKLLEANGR
jgi:hypothetical protein